MPAEPRAEALIRIFAARATAELQRLRAETEVRQREENVVREHAKQGRFPTNRISRVRTVIDPTTE